MPENQKIDTIENIFKTDINEVKAAPDKGELSLESLALLINIERLKYLENKSIKELNELKQRQDEVSSLHKLIKAINSATVNNTLDLSTNGDIQALLTQAKASGVDVKDDKTFYNKEERERLLENIRLTVDDMNVLNDMQLQTVTRLTTERYESYQLARSIMKPLHEDKTNKARAIRGG